MNSNNTTTTAAEPQNRIDVNDDCPECGGNLYREPMCVHGGPTDVTSGVACLDCTWYQVDSRDDPNACNPAGQDPQLIADEVRAAMKASEPTHACPECDGQARMLGGANVPDDVPLECDAIEGYECNECGCSFELEITDGESVINRSNA